MSTATIKDTDLMHVSVSTSDGNAGLCLVCSRKLTLCGVPFTLDVICSKCNHINHFVESKQPVSVTSMDSCVLV